MQEGNSAAIEAAVDAITHGMPELLPLTRRELAARILDEWPHGGELTSQERDEVLARFPEVVTRPAAEVDEDDPTFATLAEVYRLGRAWGMQESRETLEALERIDTRLKAAAAKHAFTVEQVSGTGMDDWMWHCACGTTIIQLHSDTDIQQRLQAHARGESR